MIGRILVLVGVLLGMSGLFVLAVVWAFRLPYGLQGGLVEVTGGVLIAAIGQLLIRRATTPPELPWSSG